MFGKLCWETYWWIYVERYVEGYLLRDMLRDLCWEICWRIFVGRYVERFMLRFVEKYFVDGFLLRWCWTCCRNYSSGFKDCNTRNMLVGWYDLLWWHDAAILCQRARQFAFKSSSHCFLVQSASSWQCRLWIPSVSLSSIMSKHMVSEPQLCKYLIVHLWFSDSQSYRPPSQDFMYNLCCVF